MGKAGVKVAPKVLGKSDEAAGNARRAAPGCRNSFVPGTLVVMADGSHKPIEEVEPGDRVIATDPETGKTVSKRVVATIVGTGSKDLVEVTVDTDGASGAETGIVVATAEHPFWADDHGRWLPAEDITAGDKLRTPSGTLITVLATHEWTQHRTVHNLSITGIHTYHVLAGETPVLVHNTCGGDKWTTRGNLNKHFDDHGAEMGFDSPAEYAAAAEDLMCTCVGRRPDVLQKRDGGKNYFLDPDSGEFGIMGPDGVVTYFKPDDPMDYFKRQPGVTVP